jgi:hypothetical protein
MKFLFAASVFFVSVQGHAQRADNLYVDGVITDTLNSLYGQAVDMPGEQKNRSCSIFGSSRGGFHKWGKSTFQKAKVMQTGIESYVWNVSIPYRCEYYYRHFEACTGFEDVTMDVNDLLTINASLGFGDDNILRVTSIHKSTPALPSMEKMGAASIGRCGDALIEIMNARLNGLHISD